MNETTGESSPGKRSPVMTPQSVPRPAPAPLGKAPIWTTPIIIIVGLLGFIILVLLLWSMHASLCASGNSSSQSEDAAFYIEIGKISERTEILQKTLESSHQSETLRLTALSLQVEKLNDQMSKIQDAANTVEISKELQDVNKRIGMLKQELADLQSAEKKNLPATNNPPQANPSQKTIGLININSH